MIRPVFFSLFAVDILAYGPGDIGWKMTLALVAFALVAGFSSD